MEEVTCPDVLHAVHKVSVQLDCMRHEARTYHLVYGVRRRLRASRESIVKAATILHRMSSDGVYSAHTMAVSEASSPGVGSDALPATAL